MISFVSAPLLLLGLCSLVGCGSAVVVSTPLAAVAAPVSVAALTSYHAYGDSITYGATLASPSTQAYPVLVAADKSLTLTNSAIGGRQSCDVAVEEIFPVGDSPALNNGTLYSLLISTNDINFRGVGAYESTFRLCQLAASSWLAIPEEMKVRATASSVVTSGSTWVDTSNHWGAVVTNAPGATISLPLILSSASPVYLWYHSIDSSTGTFAVLIDGVKAQDVTTATVPAMATAAGHTDSLAVLRLPSVAAGRHTLTVQQTSSGQGGAWIIGVGVPPAQTTTGMPLLLIGTTPKYEAGSSSVCALDDSPCQAYIADIKQTVNTLAADNLNVILFDSRKYETGTSADMNDALHPNVLGQQELQHSVEDALQ